MSKIEVNQISSQCGSTLTIGQSGDTVTLACGATQSGFGRTGTVNWDTTAKTASFTAVSGNGYFVNTTSGAITVTLPASPSAGDIVGIKDYAGTFGTNNVTVARNGSNIDGTATDATLPTNQLSVFFVYVDGTQGWKATQSDAGDYGARFVTATGGTILTCGDFKTHVFTSPGTFCISCAGNASGSSTVDYLVVAGGGGGGGGRNCVGPGAGAGSGAGGFRLSNGYALPAPTMSPLSACVSALPVTATGYPITVGGGGAGGVPSATANQGSIGNNSIFSTITSTGGGGGKSMGNLGGTPVPENGNPGGSGGGGGNPVGTAGAGNTPPVSPPQGQPGGAGAPNGRSSGGGGAGAAGSGYSPCAPNPGNGGDGSYLSDSFLGPTAPSYGTPGPVGSTRYFAGGGAGSAYNPQGYPAGTGGAGGGGDGATPPDQNAAGNAGTANTGGGSSPAQGGYTSGGAAGGSGIVIIRYKFQ